jgi:Spy/CpxP family protein refolding chaperone
MMRLKNILAISFTVFVLALTAAGQQAPPQTQQAFAPDPIEQLQLTPDQRQSIRQILQESQGVRQQTNHRLREANVALDQALDAEPIDENLIEQRIGELALAQTAQTRMRIQTEIKIRRILRPEQIATLRHLRLQVRDVMSPQRMTNPRRPARDALRPRP